MPTLTLPVPCPAPATLTANLCCATQVTNGNTYTYQLSVINDPGVALPGFWYLFAVDMAGVPSVSWTMQVGQRKKPKKPNLSDRRHAAIKHPQFENGVALFAPMTLIQAAMLSSLPCKWRQPSRPYDPHLTRWYITCTGHAALAGLRAPAARAVVAAAHGRAAADPGAEPVQPALPHCSLVTAPASRFPSAAWTQATLMRYHLQ